ncbi:GAF domain-containing protein [Saccharopolyspora taberi]|uniref:Uncharacterized protein n=1 Tax=Saccharopolyspora taberi TaxID=60895 RepID=A0ABN3VDC8_9PSEU
MDPDVRDRERFVEYFRKRAEGTGQRGVADARSQLWSPLALQFADMGRDLFAAGTVSEVLQLIADFAAAVVPGASSASVTTRDAVGGLSTLAHTDRLCAELDLLQHRLGEGPALRAADDGGTGLGYSADLTADQAWPRFGPQAADRGVRSALAAGVVLAAEGRKAVVTLWSSEPRGLAAADPDVALVLASYSAIAIDAAGARNDARVREPLRSSDVMIRAADTLIGNRGLPPEDAYDVLWRAARGLVEAWRG